MVYSLARRRRLLIQYCQHEQHDPLRKHGFAVNVSME
jgi:hypothetical protein